MKRIMGTSSLALIVMLTLVLMVFPASAAVTGQGQVVGTVTLTNGTTCIPVATAAKAVTTYSFSGVVITGDFADGANSYNGPVGVTNVNGGSNPSGENTIGGSGNVNTIGSPASFSGSTGGKTISGTFYGNYSRNGSIVTVSLIVTASINGAASQTFPLTVAANFQPTSGNGVTTPICAATFSGVYKV